MKVRYVYHLLCKSCLNLTSIIMYSVPEMERKLSSSPLLNILNASLLFCKWLLHRLCKEIIVYNAIHIFQIRLSRSIKETLYLLIKKYFKFFCSLRAYKLWYTGTFLVTHFAECPVVLLNSQHLKSQTSITKI